MKVRAWVMANTGKVSSPALDSSAYTAKPGVRLWTFWMFNKMEKLWNETSMLIIPKWSDGQLIFHSL